LKGKKGLKSWRPNAGSGHTVRSTPFNLQSFFGKKTGKREKENETAANHFEHAPQARKKRRRVTKAPRFWDRAGHNHIIGLRTKLKGKIRFRGEVTARKNHLWMAQTEEQPRWEGGRHSGKKRKAGEERKSQKHPRGAVHHLYGGMSNTADQEKHLNREETDVSNRRVGGSGLSRRHREPGGWAKASAEATSLAVRKKRGASGVRFHRRAGNP